MCDILICSCYIDASANNVVLSYIVSFTDQISLPMTTFHILIKTSSY